MKIKNNKKIRLIPDPAHIVARITRSPLVCKNCLEIFFLHTSIVFKLYPPGGCSSHCCCCQHHPRTTSLHIQRHPARFGAWKYYQQWKWQENSHKQILDLEIKCERLLPPAPPSPSSRLRSSPFPWAQCWPAPPDKKLWWLLPSLQRLMSYSFCQLTSNLMNIRFTSQSSYSLNSVLRGLIFSWKIHNLQHQKSLRSYIISNYQNSLRNYIIPTIKTR